jgi:hypothetical protein
MSYINGLKQIMMIITISCLTLNNFIIKAADRRAVPIKLLPQAPEEHFFGSRIQRTMTLLASSNKQAKNRIKILFYGQSIVGGMYWQDIVAELKNRYPYANIIAENRAIGGFAAPKLVRVAVHDLYPFYPDLVVFHDYTAKSGEWERMIYNIRKYTTAEIMIFTHQIATAKRQQARTSGDDSDSAMIRYIAQKYNCELVEVRKEWKNYLKIHKLEPYEFLLGDKQHPNVHPNAKGHTLLAQMVMRHFRENTVASGGWFNIVRTHEARRAVEEKNDEITFPGKPWSSITEGILGDSSKNCLKLTFYGNRVDIVSASYSGKLGTAKILVDGKELKTYSELYYVTRPSKAYHVWYPAIKRVTLGENPIAEKWTLEISKMSNDGKSFKFSISGSVTGSDGHGSNKADFVSKSGRIKIKASDFTIIETQKYKREPCPKNFKVTWEVKQAFQSIWKPTRWKKRVTLFQGLTNGKHLLEIIPENNGIIPIKSLIVYNPPLK